MIGRLLPLGVFLLLAVLLAVGLTIADRKTEIPSPLIGKPMPQFSLPVLGQPAIQLGHEDLLGEPFLLNVWASWCVTCRVEHPVIEALAKSERIPIVGLNYRDAESDALAWLEHFGNPYAVNLADESGRTAIDFGVYAAPETFLIDAEGRIVFKHIGALTPEIIESEILARLEAGNTP
ncbi:DsbE family thiol:disulfide interchange protein [Elongatibacter sediminis]|uniref:DsbE family thiol:disulfide interchange protein n=1 Tax=Elongatibacter sediminis TaxID=3119006 RepID=A0AAW9RKD0_9GAMM